MKTKQKNKNKKKTKKNKQTNKQKKTESFQLSKVNISEIGPGTSDYSLQL